MGTSVAHCGGKYISVSSLHNFKVLFPLNTVPYVYWSTIQRATMEFICHCIRLEGVMHLVACLAYHWTHQPAICCAHLGLYTV